MSNLTRYKFKDICLDKGFIRGPFGSALKKSLFVPKSEDTYKVYEQCVPLEQDKSKGNYYITGDYFRQSLGRFEVKHNDFLVSCSGVNYGAIYHLKEPFEPGVINQALLIIRINDKIVDYNYFKYLFKIILSRAITSGTGDSTIPNFPSIDVIKDIDVYLPKIDVQQKIGALLNCIDEKMINNIHVNDYLQQMAKTLYDYWFVQFDFPDENGKPYRTSGGEMEWNEQLKREIPKGWNVKPIIDEFDVCYGYPFDTTKFTENEDGISIIRIRDILENTTSAKTLEIVDEKYKVNRGDLIVGMDGNFHMNFWSGHPALLNQRCFKISSLGYSVLIAYFSAKPYIKAREKNVTRTTVGHLSANDVQALSVLVPTEPEKRKFSAIFDDILNKICQTRRENEELTKLRDWLLPMLMNGQARVE